MRDWNVFEWAFFMLAATFAATLLIDTARGDAHTSGCSCITHVHVAVDAGTD